jgi:hypothetical protein
MTKTALCLTVLSLLGTPVAGQHRNPARETGDNTIAANAPPTPPAPPAPRLAGRPADANRAQDDPLEPPELTVFPKDGGDYMLGGSPTRAVTTLRSLLNTRRLRYTQRDDPSGHVFVTRYHPRPDPVNEGRRIAAAHLLRIARTPSGPCTSVHLAWHAKSQGKHDPQDEWFRIGSDSEYMSVLIEDMERLHKDDCLAS